MDYGYSTWNMPELCRDMFNVQPKLLIEFVSLKALQAKGSTSGVLPIHLQKESRKGNVITGRIWYKWLLQQEKSYDV